MDNEIHKQINWLDRERIVQILENYGIACYNDESTDELREALRINIMDGTIPEEDLE